MPNLLQIVVEGNTGSTGTIAETFGNFAIQAGWKSYIAHGRFPRPSSSEIIRIESKLGVLMHAIETRLFDRHGLGSRFATKRLIKKIINIKPDIIQLHHLHGYYINIKILFDFLSKANIPVVWTFHDCWSITGHCCHFDYVNCIKWLTKCYKCPQVSEYPASFFWDRSSENYWLKKRLFKSVPNLTIVSVSKWLNNIVECSFLSELKHAIIYNGIDISIFSSHPSSESVRKQIGIKDSFLIIGVASTWSKRKGLKDFITLSRLIDIQDTIVLIGLNNSQIKELPENVIGLERTENQTELSELYSAANVFINFSVEETFGLTTAEALSCGTPVIVYNSTACPEIVDSATGIVVNKHDIAGVIDAIELIKKNGKEFYSTACRRRAVNLFNKNDRFMDYMDLYRQLIAKA
jgi:putative colanic acid biosynthesis glycosyltransferase